jgi:SAM-dependent methyltransferase
VVSATDDAYLPPEGGGAGRRSADASTTTRANRRWWDGDADNYHAEHGAFLGIADFVWCPEGVREADAHLLGEVAGRRILEVGAGSAMCSRWLATQGARPTAVDLSGGMLRHARAGAAATGIEVPLVQAAFGAVPFVADSARVMREVARVLRPGRRWVFATSHPFRWVFPDDPGPLGLTATMSYFDRTPYVEFDQRGETTYVEHHRTLGDRVAEINAAGFRLVAVIEPEWPAELTQEWGQWSPLRGAILPGTAIYVCELT